ncbi:hypothetical protein BRPE64_DCDS04840 (plasmid) [Caballeronia insecticola]|uniref:Uncharacterized protein n=1 Tax=Caballeronia insecticola TaxID=758793 RepID=R4X008_9BURK|nr:hypothetical protein BRPE64_DCDS04840 [Caballeronia insecticola]
MNGRLAPCLRHQGERGSAQRARVSGFGGQHSKLSRSI